MIRFTVFGTPQPAGSKRAFPFRRGNGTLGAHVVDANPKSRDWKTAVSQTAAEQFRGELLGGALAVEFTFRVVRPKGHFGKRGLLPSAPEFPTGRPDLLKLARGVEDALSGIVWRDDALIVDETLAKRYGEQAGVDIVIRPLLGRVQVPAVHEEEPLPLFAAGGVR